MPRIITRFE